MFEREREGNEEGGKDEHVSRETVLEGAGHIVKKMLAYSVSKQLIYCILIGSVLANTTFILIVYWPHLFIFSAFLVYLSISLSLFLSLSLEQIRRN